MLWHVMHAHLYTYIDILKRMLTLNIKTSDYVRLMLVTLNYSYINMLYIAYCIIYIVSLFYYCTNEHSSLHGV